MSLRETGTHEDTKCENFHDFHDFHDFTKVKYYENETFLVNRSDFMSKFTFSELKAFFANPFPKRLIIILSNLSIYFHRLRGMY